MAGTVRDTLIYISGSFNGPDDTLEDPARPSS
jgi:hypothetical protein